MLVKASADTRLATALVYIGGGVLAAMALPFLPVPARASWPYIAAATVTELGYGIVLAAAYRVGDLSHAYPLMRGAAPLLVALGSGALIGEHLSSGVWAGVALVSCGIFSLVFDAHSQGHSPAATRLALLNALLIAAYTTIDGIGVRRSGQPVAYSLWLSLLIAVPWLVWVAVGKGARPYRELRRYFPSAAVGAVFGVASYTLALWAMTRAPVAAVAAVRETALVFATALGAIVLRERVTRVRVLAAMAIAVGVWVIRTH
ncbi:MAG: EamA family transporter [Gammaproteobacteria bacterium]|nr:EamA family transporter [Gammaproteobacteria bacterium]